LGGASSLTFTRKEKVNKGMSKPHRIAAGGITFKDNRVLLVRYCASNNAGTYLVGPGGALEDGENVVQAIIRETKEETGIIVQPKRVIAIEDLMCSAFKMIKVWMVCEIVEGEVQKTAEAEKENILEAAWFTRDQLAREVVFPPSLMQHDWEEFQTEIGQVECLPSREASF
jgi:8-oxo-dGTP diphosphatase